MSIRNVGQYVGCVPEKNITEMENFKILEEDMDRVEYNYYINKNGLWVKSSEKTEDYGHLDYSITSGLIRKEYIDAGYEFVKKPFFICASRRLLGENGNYDAYGPIINRFNQELPDPVVLQPIKGGYLIISKWP